VSKLSHNAITLTVLGCISVAIERQHIPPDWEYDLSVSQCGVGGGGTWGWVRVLVVGGVGGWGVPPPTKGAWVCNSLLGRPWRQRCQTAAVT